MIWTTFDFFRSVLINCINILKFKNNETSRYELISGGFKGVGSSVFLLKTFLVYIYLFILSFICRSVSQRLRTGKINLFCRVIFFR